MAILSLVGQVQTRQVYEAWKIYAAAFEAAEGLVGAYDNEHAALRQALASSISELSAARRRFDGEQQISLKMRWDSGREASYFNIGDRWKTSTPAQRTAANNHFLDIIAARGDRVLLSTEKKNIRKETALADEVTYLTQ